MVPARIKTHSPEKTKQLGRTLGEVLKKGDLIALTGELGSGKTTMIQGICKGLEVQEKVTSPTFVLITTYQGRIPVYHFDLYRLEGKDEFLNLGYEEYFYGEGVTLIEWSEKVREYLPAKRIEIHLHRLKENEREIEIISYGKELKNIVAVDSSSQERSGSLQ